MEGYNNTRDQLFFFDNDWNLRWEFAGNRTTEGVSQLIVPDVLLPTHRTVSTTSLTRYVQYIREITTDTLAVSRIRTTTPKTDFGAIEGYIYKLKEEGEKG